jgi:TPR repeat protein
VLCLVPAATAQDSSGEMSQARLSLEELTVKAEAGDPQAQVELGTRHFEGRLIPKDNKQALYWYDKAAQQGYAEGQNRLGMMYYYGYGVKQDFGQALNWYTKASLQKHGQATYELSVMHLRGEGVSADQAKSAQLCIQSAELGFAFGQFALGQRYIRGMGVPQDYRLAHQWLQKAAEQNVPDAQVDLGIMHLQGMGVDQDFQEALKWFEPTAERGHPRAKHNLGTMYLHGLGVQQDRVKALGYFREAAEQGLVEAQVTLGAVHLFGMLVPQDTQEALRWYHKAAEQGSPEAYHSIGLLYYEGRGIQQDYQKAFEWMLKAAEAGRPESQGILGDMYRKGCGVQQSLEKAFEWYLKAAEQGYPASEYNVAQMYSQGAGVARNTSESIKWYAKVAATGDRDALLKLFFACKNGEGLEADPVEAFKWLLVGEAHGFDLPAFRDPLQQSLTAEQIQQARQAADEVLRIAQHQTAQQTMPLPGGSLFVFPSTAPGRADKTVSIVPEVSVEKGPRATGDLRDPAALTFVGNETFSRNDLLDGLMHDADFLLAAHPLAPLQEYLQTLEAQVTAGYLEGGFPEARVQVELDEAAGRIVVRIQEGSRCLYGKVDIEGMAEEDAAALRERLTKPESWFHLAPRVLWKVGQPASFSRETVPTIKSRVSTVLAEMGYFFPWVDVSIAPEPQENAARLKIVVRDLGPRGIISDIQVEGNERHSDDEIMEYLELRRGMTFDRQRVEAIKARLRASGRFVQSEVSVRPEFSKEPKVNLHICVKEYEHAPRLNEEPTLLQKALLQSAAYVNGWAQGGDDLVISVTADLQGEGEGKRVAHLYISPRQGILFSGDWDDPNDRQTRGWGVYVSPTNILAVSARHKGKLTIPQTKLRFILSIAIGCNPEEPRPFGVNCGFGFRTDSSYAPFTADVQMSPLVAMVESHELISGRSGHSYELADDVLTLHIPVAVAKIDVPTGRLMEVQGEDQGRRWIVRAEAGAFAAAMAELNRRTAGYQEQTADAPSLRSVLLFAANGYAAVRFATKTGPGLYDERFGDVLAKVLPPSLDSLLPPARADGDTRFKIPTTAEGSAPEMMAALATHLSAWVFGMTNAWFPRQSWPWTLSRETVFILGGRGKYSMAELQRLYESGEMGPVGYLTAAQVLSRINPGLGGAFAGKGLNNLTAKDFHKDVHVFLAGDLAMGRCLIDVGKGVRSLDEQEIPILLSPFDEGTRAVMRRAVDRLRLDASEPVEDALPAAMDELWEALLRDRVESSLRRLAAKLLASH